MSSFNLGKKLVPAKKAWKSFSATFQSKLQKLKLRKAIKRAKKRCVLAFNYIRPLLSRKFYSLMIRRHSSSSCSSSKRPLQRRHHNTLNFPAIYVDELFPEPLISAPPPKRHGEEQPKVGPSTVGESSSSNGGGGGGWRVPSLPPHFRGVDERAEDFISKFRQDMKLEREQSILDFQEMLARGT
ncbi:uncharacterized protein LOC116001651 [Ipomoea triloba]|uniref:uncharacterized protein LOC116001651 n=1 Tax=Ipomoea triloba TaxID=35885 RepID=UPI00125D4969|nr:uncharacterized protein LOC116001651 [Ipomoea triloba]